jgi:hypothetical protein
MIVVARGSLLLIRFMARISCLHFPMFMDLFTTHLYKSKVSLLGLSRENTNTLGVTLQKIPLYNTFSVIIIIFKLAAN